MSIEVYSEKCQSDIVVELGGSDSSLYADWDNWEDWRWTDSGWNNWGVWADSYWDNWS